MRGTCEEFCPQQEAKWRIKEKLLNFFEYKDGEKNVPGVLVKSFARSAAGTKAPSPKNLRTEDCLQRTVEYLLTNILQDDRRPFHIVYDFIFDRLRAVRQETIIQDFDGRQTMRILEPIIMFLAYSRYRLCVEPVENFDPKICDQHLQECLKRILIAYDEIGTLKIFRKHQCQNRIFIEALYQIYNLGSVEALSRGLQLPVEIKSNDLFKSVFAMSLNYHQSNIFRVISGIRTLPHVLCAIGSLRIQSLRRKCYQIFSHAYNSKQFTVPLEFISRIFQQSKTELIKDCQYYGLKVTDNNKAIQFIKSDYDTTIPTLSPKHETFVTEKFKKLSLPEILLVRNLINNLHHELSKE